MCVREEALSRARASFEAGEYHRSAAIAAEGLVGDPDDAELLRVAGASTLALDSGDASPYFSRLVAVAPDDVAAWRDLGSALLAEGRGEDAAAAFRRALELAPDDPQTLVDLGHATGRPDEALGYLARAHERDPGNVDVLRAQLAAERRAGRPGAALAAAAEVLERRPEDVMAALDVAELSLACDRLDDAAAAYRRLRTFDAEPGHAVYVHHGLVAVEIRREGWRRALDEAIAAARVDCHRRTTDLVTYVAAQLFGAGETPPPTAQEVEEILAESSAEHRMLHVEPLGF